MTKCMQWTAMALAAFSLAAPAVQAAEADTDASQATTEITYSKQVSRLIQTNCQTCHNPNGVAPFSLMNYRQAKGWGKMIKEVVLDGRMPPWDANDAVGHKFSNNRSLSQEDKNAFASWVDNGTPRGDDAELPAPVEYSTDWRIGTPDMVFEMPEEVTVDPTGVVPYQYFMTPTNFDEDKWIDMAECRPGNPKVVHHIIMFVRDPNQTTVRDERGQGFFDAFAPGTDPMILESGVARRIPKGATLVWQMHYTPTGKEEKDRSSFGIKFAKGPITTELATTEAINFSFNIPPKADNHRVEADMTFETAAVIRSLSPHMHYRGKSFTYTLVYPDGREDLLLDVPNYDFNWQTTYELVEPINVPAGTKMHCVAHFDNSDKNPFNPDPDKTVSWGDQTWEEMMIGFFQLSWDSDNKQVAGDD